MRKLAEDVYRIAEEDAKNTQPFNGGKFWRNVGRLWRKNRKEVERGIFAYAQGELGIATGAGAEG